MLLTIQASGSKPPLFFVHGVHGVMTLGSTLARALGPDQPIYAIHANGVDGQGPVINDFHEMVRIYVESIHETRPTGPLVIGGMEAGCLAAIETARELQKRGRQVRPVILANPPTAPGKPNVPEDPQAERQLFERVQRALLGHASSVPSDVPFDARDQDRLHAATLAGVASVMALARHVPAPFPGPAQVILSAPAVVGFFHPTMPWHKLLSGPRMVHILPWPKSELLRSGRDHVARGIQFMLEEGPTLETVSESQEQDAPSIENYARTIEGIVARGMQ
jgi:thioesterase domain-containing protein